MAEQEVKKTEETSNEQPKLDVIQRGALILEVKKNDLQFSLHLPVGSSYADAYYATFEMLKEIERLAKAAQEAAKEQQEKNGDSEKKSEEAQG